MNRIMVIFALLICYFTSPAQHSFKSGFKVVGEISGHNNGALLLEYNGVNGTLKRDTAYIKNGKFHFKGIVTEPTIARLYGNINFPSLYEKNLTTFFLENNILTINISMDHFRDIKITGSKTQDEVSLLIKKENELQDKIPVIDKESNILSIKISNETNTDNLKVLSRKAEYLSSLRKSYTDTISMLELQFSKEHPHSFASPEYLLKQSDTIPIDTVIRTFNSFDSILKNSQIGIKINMFIVKKTVSFKGYYAPNFKTNDIDNQQIELVKFRAHKYVLLDFWASYCIPCRMEFPLLKRLYNDYSNQGLEIIGISVEEDSAQWRKAINQDSIQIWKNILFTQYNFKNIKAISKDEKDFYEQYFINGVPVMILINKEGKIIERFEGNTDENKLKLEVVLKYLLENSH